ncbi:hypothetical protein [Paucibacter soli]|uniref:hypothetical protein n=1 Tax=Paucibacter soli TaxID=3133433 RepID=UPI0030A6C681
MSTNPKLEAAFEAAWNSDPKALGELIGSLSPEELNASANEQSLHYKALQSFMIRIMCESDARHVKDALVWHASASMRTLQGCLCAPAPMKPWRLLELGSRTSSAMQGSSRTSTSAIARRGQNVLHQPSRRS